MSAEPERVQNAIASVAVADMAAAVAWYRALFARDADSTPMAGVAEWRFPRGGWLQVVALPERAGGGSATLAVDDVDALARHLEALGLDTGRRTASTGVKTLTLADPDGNQLTFAQALDPTIAR